MRDDGLIQRITAGDVVVTTALRPDGDAIRRARTIAEELGCPFHNRAGDPLDDVRAATGRQNLIILTWDEVRLVTPGNTFLFHPNMAARRIEAMLRGEVDRLSSFMDLKSGDCLLDATCGLGADAIVAAHTVGEAGRVLAVERSRLLGAMVRHGMKIYRHRTLEVESAMRRVEVVTAEAEEVLKSEADHSWDVVTFDPMFDETVTLSHGLDVVKMLGWPGSTTPEGVAEASRVARRCVVMKDRAPGNKLRDLGFAGGKATVSVPRSGNVYYGRIDV